MTRTETVHCDRCEGRFQRPAGETYRTCLGCESTARLVAAGIAADDPALAFISAWNAEAQRKAATRAEA